jgi:hypothetical protein
MGFCCNNDSLEVLSGLKIYGAACLAILCFDTIGQCVHHFVGVGDGGIGDALVFELNGVG